MRNVSGSCGVGFVCHIKGSASHDIVRWGIEAVKNLTHRGAVGADGKTGDGAGVLTRIPMKFFLRELTKRGIVLSDPSSLAVGFFFLRHDIESGIERTLSGYGFRPLLWRDVPVNDSALGKSAFATKPRIRQLLLDAGVVEPGVRERCLYLARKALEKTYGPGLYVPSMSSKTIVYKGLLVATHLEEFYPDLADRDFESPFCIFHQRFSTNTFPDWIISQPFRVLAHNGEINTLQGNRNWAASVGHEVRHDLFGEENDLIIPLISTDESDSASLDRIAELLVVSGHSPEYVVNMCIPPAWENSDDDEKTKAFFEYQSLLMKPWDGPAAVVLTDGETVCAHMDRNGLRPHRYTITDDGIIVLGSEAGMIDLQTKEIREKGRLGPGETLAVDLKEGRIKNTEEILSALSELRPFGKWLEENLLRLGPGSPELAGTEPDLIRKQIAFGYTSEEISTSIKEMAEKAKEFTYSMGDDVPLPPLAEKPQLLFRYFKQRFSQVTNPPIDPIRERMVMSLRMALGHKKNFLIESPGHAHRLKIASPILFESELKGIEQQERFPTGRISITYPVVESKHIPDPGKTETQPTGGRIHAAEESQLFRALQKLGQEVVDALRKGVEILIFSDRDISAGRVAIPSLLAVSCAYKTLQKERLANRTSIIVESGEPRDPHHIACLVGYGASAVHPYLALQTIKDLCDSGGLVIPFGKAASNYRRAVEDGLLRIISRLGISTLNSYYAAQLFDTICLDRDFVENFFTGTPVTIESDGIFEIEESLMKRHGAGFGGEDAALDFGGNLRHRKGGEWHQWSTSSVAAFIRFVKNPAEDSYREFSLRANERPAFLRNLLAFRKNPPIPVEEVEPAESILKRFFSGAMSVGALSPEAHETIAEACNRLHIRSNSGEGGEDPARYRTIKNSAIKQIASGRFGVTPAYLASASELEIKIAQGAKPGEGGHLPLDKVTPYIASLRHCSPHMLLISPPPHHDIYSIEDLAQLINDLKEANPEAKVCVKLVAEAGVGAVAAGVAKAYADIVQISGCEGGTGAASIGSIRNAGNYWEAGLAEAQRVLIENGLRERITMRADGGLRTGADIIIAALLGAEEFGFGTASMIATGCIMARQCHLNTCPTGVATQDERLRKKFRGTVEGVMAYFSAVAREVREIMAASGFRTMAEMIGRGDLLKIMPADAFPASKRIRAGGILDGYPSGGARMCIKPRNDNPSPSMNDILIRDLLPFVEKAEAVSREYEIRNVDRSVPLRLNYHIARKYGDAGLPSDTIRLRFRGTAGQSFGAFNHRGLTLVLMGEANDYAGKGMYGGRIVIRPNWAGKAYHSVITGNTTLYGATGGEMFVAGHAGERFAVRNSGATAVVEGCGHHLCEYMTRGIVVVLGRVGNNVGAGMTGGTLYIFDEAGDLERKINRSYVTIRKMEDDRERAHLRSLMEKHLDYTGSPRAGEILEEFKEKCLHFKKIIPV
jgi:glutamate synthase (NADPH/NADH) large chain